MDGHVTYHVPLAAPQDLRISDPRPIHGWSDEKAKQVVGVRIQIRLGDDPDAAAEVAEALGIITPPVEKVSRADVLRRLGAYRVSQKTWAYQCTSCGEERKISSWSWAGVRVCMDCRRKAAA